MMLIDLVTISSFSVVVPFLIGVLLYKRLPSAGRWITWLMTVWLAAETISYLLRIRGITNWNVYMLLSLAELMIVTTFYKQIFVNSKAKRIIVILAWLGMLIAVSEFILMKGPANSVTLLYESVFFIGMGLYASYEIAIAKRSPEFSVLIVGISVLFLGSAVYFSSWNFMKYDEGLFRIFGTAHAYLLIICYSIFSYGLWRLQL